MKCDAFRHFSKNNEILRTLLEEKLMEGLSNLKKEVNVGFFF